MSEALMSDFPLFCLLDIWNKHLPHKRQSPVFWLGHLDTDYTYKPFFPLRTSGNICLLWKHTLGDRHVVITLPLLANRQSYIWRHCDIFSLCYQSLGLIHGEGAGNKQTKYLALLCLTKSCVPLLRNLWTYLLYLENREPYVILYHISTLNFIGVLSRQSSYTYRVNFLSCVVRYYRLACY